jgi:hypothetical protein
MKTAKHTPAPWRVNFAMGPAIFEARDPEGIGMLRVDLDTDVSSVDAHANANRILECVNACEGIDEPAEMIEACRLLLDFLSGTVADQGKVTVTCGSAVDKAIMRLRASFGVKS